MLCETCQSIFRERRRVINDFRGGEQRFQHHKTVDDLQKAAKNHCQICQSICRVSVRRALAVGQIAEAVTRMESATTYIVHELQGIQLEFTSIWGYQAFRLELNDNG